jgi:hypothetical protein
MPPFYRANPEFHILGAEKPSGLQFLDTDEGLAGL